tara:strand:+ start:376 stop:762 length:387 start_codon:yes stop_codon:yes gene_type:complete
MSTLKTSNIQDTSGSNNSTPEEISQGRAKAWINFDGTASSIGTGRNNYNVSSVTDNGGGNYTITLTNGTANTNSAVFVSGTRSALPNSNYSRMSHVEQKTTTTIRVHTWDSASTKEDHITICVAVFGD